MSARRLRPALLPTLTALVALGALGGLTPLPAQAAGLCEADPASTACREATDAFERAEQAWRDQAAQLQRLKHQQATLAQLGDLQRRRDALAVAALEHADVVTREQQQLAARWQALQAPCRGASARADRQLEAADAFRRDAIAFAHAPTATAPAAAARADAQHDALRAAESALAQQAAACRTAHGDVQAAQRQEAAARAAAAQGLAGLRDLQSDVLNAAERLAAPRWPLAQAEQAAVETALRSRASALAAWVDGAPASAPPPAAMAERVTELPTVQTELVRTTQALARLQDADALDDSLARRPCAGRCAHPPATQRALQGWQAASSAARQGDRAREALVWSAPDGRTAMEAAVAQLPALSTPSDALARALEAQAAVERDELRAREARVQQAHAAAFGEPWHPSPLLQSSGPHAVAASGPTASMAIARFHAVHFVGAEAPEPTGYAAYTDVYLRQRPGGQAGAAWEALAQTALAEVVSSRDAASSEVREAMRDQFNLFCIPSLRAREFNRTVPTDPGPLLAHYDFALAKQRVLQMSSGAALRLYLQSSKRGLGPVLITRFKPLAAMRAGDRFLLFDLSGLDPSYVADLLAGYKERFEGPPPVEALEVWQPSLAQRVIMSVADFGLLAARLQKAGEAWKTLQAVGGGSKQTLVMASATPP